MAKHRAHDEVGTKPITNRILPKGGECSSKKGSERSFILSKKK